jgi:hypothetical protein
MKPGLPDGIFSNKKIPISINFRVLKRKVLVDFMTIWSILLPFGIFCGRLGKFSRFGLPRQEKSGNPE